MTELTTALYSTLPRFAGASFGYYHKFCISLLAIQFNVFCEPTRQFAVDGP